MTKEEAAIIIHKLKQDVLTGAVRRYEPLEGEVLLSAEFYDAINMAIEALQQKPCADAISRQAAIDACLNGWNKDYKEIVEEIRALPPVKPQYTDAEIQKMQDLEFAEIQKAYEIGKLEQEPCTDAISREDALMALTGEYTDSPIEILPKAIKRINALPPVNPVEKVGQWIDVDGIWFKCSECDAHRKMMPAYKEYYCPNCGAKMQEVDAE